MIRVPIVPRGNWQEEVEKWGMLYHTFDDKPYWSESACYVFASTEIEVIEKATNDLEAMCMAAVQHVIDKKRYAELHIPDKAIPAIEWSWGADVPSLYGRFDLAYDGVQPPKLLEYNADTPTALLEAAVIQWQWLKQVQPEADQFNSIWEALVAKWKKLKDEPGCLTKNFVHFAHQDSLEDLMTVTLLRDTAQEAGIQTDGLHMEDIGWDSTDNTFIDLQNRVMTSIFKLYPWEWILKDEFSGNLLETVKEVKWIEPIWKMILSNKGILPILWELYPDHENLLPSYFDGPRDLSDYVKKPLLSREGANITIKYGDQIAETEGQYGAEGFIYQKLFELPNLNGNFPVLGSWVIDGEAHGIGIRESDNLVTDDYSRFVPHYFK